MTTKVPGPAGQIRLGQPAGRWVLLATVLGSSLALLDSARRRWNPAALRP